MNYKEVKQIFDINGWEMSRGVKHYLVAAIYYENKIKQAMSKDGEINVTSIRTFSDFKMKEIKQALKLADFEKKLGTDIYDKDLKKLVFMVGRDNPDLMKLLMLNLELAETYRKDQQLEREHRENDAEFKRLYDSIHGAQS